MISLSIAVPHAAWIPERAESMRRIRAELGVLPAEWHAHESQRAGLVAYKEFTEQEPHYQWAPRLWSWSERQRVTHCLFVSDDVIVSSGAIDILLAMLEAVPDQPLGLTSQSPSAPRLLRQGAHWYRAASPWCVGVAYLLPRPMLRSFLAWHSKQPETLLRGPESADDQLVNRFLAEVGVQTWHPIPTPFDHDLSIRSSLGHPIDRDGRREASSKVPMPRVTSCGYPEEYWKSGSTAPPIVSVPPTEEEWVEWENSRRPDTIPAEAP